MHHFQDDFLKAIKNIQASCVGIAMCGHTVFNSKEEELYSVTYDVIYRIMELLDGYGDDKVGSIDIVKRSTGESLTEPPHIELHDAIASYIKGGHFDG
ncbi:MAG: hypothetical protein IJ055_04765 [Oscillospiraceae bacterium]|nr:hypothetical protein [Oscillospiraceae bacterium]